MESEDLLNRIQSLLKDFNGNFSLLEEEIDIKTQMEYFEISMKMNENEFVVKDQNIPEAIFSNNIAIEDKKRMLIKLATNRKVESYRLLEKYRQNPDPALKDWSILALQESKMLLESTFLNQNQVFISTGLGGKGKNLRYFIVLLSKNKIQFGDFQKKVISGEVEFMLKKMGLELEKMIFSNNYFCLKVCLPIDSNISEIFTSIIDSCNQFGSILEDNYIITNVKELSNNEIQDIIQNNHIPNSIQSSGIDQFENQKD